MLPLKSYCGWPLQCGTRIAGGLTIIYSIFGLIFLYFVDEDAKMSLDKKAYYLNWSLLFTYLVFSSIFLTIGTIKEIKNLLLPWLVGSPAIMIGSFIFVLLFRKETCSAGFVFFILTGLYNIGYNSYLTMVVASYYCELNDKDKEQRNNFELRPSSEKNISLDVAAA